jgi:pimeloyl-ACP methyl ester carboxylesterase
MKCPLLLLHGQQDPLCPLAGVKAIAQAARDATLTILPGGGHCDMAGRDPERYLEAVAPFVARLARTG